MSTGTDPLPGFRFSVSIIGGGSVATLGYFSSLTGMSAEQEVAEYKVYNPYTKQDRLMLIPGRRTAGEVTLKQGVTEDFGFWAWRSEAVHLNQRAVRSLVHIMMYDWDGSVPTIPVAWELLQAWPSRISGPEFDAESSKFGIEELTITYELVTRIPVPTF